MQRTASAVWNGSLKHGSGRISGTSSALVDVPYSFASRFEGGAATNPEELLGAAHAGCFGMMTTALLGAAGFTADRLAVKAVVTLEQIEGAWTINKVALSLDAVVPGVSAEKFAEIAAAAKAQCPVSRLFKAEITLEAALHA